MVWYNKITHRIYKRNRAHDAMHSAIYKAVASKTTSDCLTAICIVKRYLAYQQALINALGDFPLWQKDEMIVMRDYKASLIALTQEYQAMTAKQPV